MGQLFINSLFRRLETMLKNLLGGGKKKEFFLELDESADAPTSEAKVETPAPEAKVETPAPEPTEVVEQSAPAKKSKKTSIKKKAKKETPKTEIVPTSSPLNSETTLQKEEPKEVEFATKFYMTSTPRRRPGPSLNNFQDMASQV